MADFGLKVSKDGYDVNTATATQLAYSSKWSNFKIKEVLTGTITLTGVQTGGTTTVANTLNYSPIYFPFVKSSTIGTKYRPALMGGTVTMPDDTNWAGVTVRYRPGTNDFYLTIAHIGSGTRTFTFKIVLFVDKFTGSGSSIASIKDYGLKVSKAGFDAGTTVDHNLSMTSKFANLTVAAAGTSSVTNTGTVSHSLGYVPIFLVFFNPTGDATDGSKYFPVPTSGFWNSTTEHIEAYADSTTLYFVTGDPSHANTFRYLIFNERLE